MTMHAYRGHAYRGRSIWKAVARVLPLTLTLPLPYVGCQGDGLQPPGLRAPNELYWTLRLDHRGILLSTSAPYDTITIAATPRNVDGEPLAGLGTPIYRSTDLEHVFVTPDGVVHAVAPTSQVVIVTATLKAGNLEHVDSALVRVVDNPAPPTLAAFSVRPIPPDSAKVGAVPLNGFMSRFLVSRATDVNGDPIPNVVADFRSSDRSVAEIVNSVLLGLDLGFDGGFIQGLRPGSVTFYASTTAYGVTKVDTVPFRIGWPLFGNDVKIDRVTRLFSTDSVVFDPPSVTVGVGAFINWANQSDTAVDVTFADGDLPNVQAAGNSPLWNEPFPPSLIGLALNLLSCGGGAECTTGGNILPSELDGKSSYRIFTAPGTYEYRSVLTGARGKIVVVDER